MNDMDRSHRYDDDLDTPPPPPWWHGFLILVAFFVVGLALISFCTSCTCTFDVESAARAIIIYHTEK